MSLFDEIAEAVAREMFRTNNDRGNFETHASEQTRAIYRADARQGLITTLRLLVERGPTEDMIDAIVGLTLRHAGTLHAPVPWEEGFRGMLTALLQEAEGRPSPPRKAERSA